MDRAENMSRIRGSNTTPELALRRALTKAGLRYRLHVKTPGGRADIVMASKKIAVFIDGCFWHGCPEHYVRPRSSKRFWDDKLTENVTRDRRQILKAAAEGWTAIRVWEHEVKESLEAVTERVLAHVNDANRAPESQWRVVEVKWLDEAGTLERRRCEDLRDPGKTFTEERERSTKKVGRVRGRPVTR